VRAVYLALLWTHAFTPCVPYPLRSNRTLRADKFTLAVRLASVQASA
jgi:hypothetical protein